MHSVTNCYINKILILHQINPKSLKMKLYLQIVIILVYHSVFGTCKKLPKTFYGLKAKYIESWDHKDTYSQKEVKFEKYRGKVVLIVNTASECVYTDENYKQLVKTYNTLNKLRLDSWEIDTPAITEPEDSYFTILGFPCDQFGDHLESAVEEAIDIFTRYKYGVLFPMFQKVKCIADDWEDAHPVWKFIAKKAKRKPDWNFYKYLIDHTGKVVEVFPYTKSVDSIYDTIVKYVDAARKFDEDLKKQEDAKNAKNDSHDEL